MRRRRADGHRRARPRAGRGAPAARRPAHARRRRLADRGRRRPGGRRLSRVHGAGRGDRRGDRARGIAPHRPRAAGPARRRGRSRIAVNGVCLTAVGRGADRVSFDLGPETLARTALGGLRAGDTVNLERPLRLGALVGGHLVQGHVDGVGVVAWLSRGAEAARLRVECRDEQLGGALDPPGLGGRGRHEPHRGRPRRRRVRDHADPAHARPDHAGRLESGRRVNLEMETGTLRDRVDESAGKRGGNQKTALGLR